MDSMIRGASDPPMLLINLAIWATVRHSATILTTHSTPDRVSTLTLLLPMILEGFTVHGQQAEAPPTLVIIPLKAVVTESHQQTQGSVHRKDPNPMRVVGLAVITQAH
jgi:hypothetical protein